ncbi:hypothetical protein MRB53_037038 [Persea americana]|nr:hypothetical protein MRB53_037038 [Persea americana]
MLFFLRTCKRGVESADQPTTVERDAVIACPGASTERTGSKHTISHTPAHVARLSSPFSYCSASYRCQLGHFCAWRKLRASQISKVRFQYFHESRSDGLAGLDDFGDLPYDLVGPLLMKVETLFRWWVRTIVELEPQDS